MTMNAINSVNSTTNSYQTGTASKTASTSTDKTTTSDKAETGVVYEKSSQTDKDTVTKKTDYAMVAKLKADAEQRTSQLRSLVEKMMTKQGTAIANADSMWSFLADGNFTVDEETQKQAQADIAEDGYWGVEQTSDRILDFAKALSGNDPEKADLLIDAFKKALKMQQNPGAKICRIFPSVPMMLFWRNLTNGKTVLRPKLPELKQKINM